MQKKKLMTNMLGKLLRFSRMHENKTFFYLCFFRGNLFIYLFEFLSSF